MGDQAAAQRREDRDVTLARVRLQRHPAALPVAVELPAQPDHRGVAVDVLPAQAERLTNPHAGEGEQDDQRRVAGYSALGDLEHGLQRLGRSAAESITG